MLQELLNDEESLINQLTNKSQIYNEKFEKQWRYMENIYLILFEI